MRGNSESEAELFIARKQASDYAMALDSLTRITHSGSEKEAIESILQLFEMLFMPKVLYYVSFENGEPDKVYSLAEFAENQTIIKSRSNIFKGRYIWTESQKGFQVKIKFKGIDFGLIVVDNVGFPEHKEHYLNLTMSITDVCGLAIENARRHQIIKDAENRLFQENEKLQKALAEVKKLSGLLPICSHCKKIRDDNGYWNQIEAYIMDRSDATFSHSVCRECAEKYYPDINIYGE